MTRQRMHDLLDLCLDFNEKMIPRARAFFDFNEPPRIAIYFGYGRGGADHVEDFHDTEYDFKRDDDVYYDGHMLNHTDIGFVKAEKRLRELMEAKDGKNT